MLFSPRNKSFIRYLTLFAFCCWLDSPVAAQDAAKTVTIKLPDGSEMRFHAVYLGIDGTRLLDSKRITIGPNKDNPSYKERRVEVSLAGGFVGKRECTKDCTAENTGTLDWLYYLGETEVQRSQWDSVLRWMDQQEGKTPPKEDAYRIENKPGLPITGLTIAELYRFIEALNSWMLQQQRERLPALNNARAFCRLPTEAEWEFAARGGIEEDGDVFDRPHPYGADLGKYEWTRSNSNGEMRNCGSTSLQANSIGLRDMLGNVEELTCSLFGPEYQQGRFGQFAIRGNSCTDAPDDFSASYRTEFAPYNPDGSLRRDKKVGFRLALSTSVSGSIPSLAAMEKDSERYFSTLGLTRPGIVGGTSPAAQAEQDRSHYLKEQLTELTTDKQKLTDELGRLKKQRDSDQARCSDISQEHQEISSTKQRLEKELADLKQRLAASPAPDTVPALQRKLKEAENEIEQLRSSSQQVPGNIAGANPQKVQEQYERSQRELAELQQKLAAQPNLQALEHKAQQAAALAAQVTALELSEQRLRQRLLETEHRLADQSHEVALKEQEVADLGRRQRNFAHEIDKNAGRVREVEKRYLEALLRQASASAALGLRGLVKIKHADKQDPVRIAEASTMIYDYWDLVVQMAEKTQADLFPQVKQELAAWLKEREAKGGSLQQRKALNLIERHLARVRGGNSLRPDDLVRSFLDQPEFN